MTDEYIDACCPEIARVLAPRGYLMQWVDTFRLCEACQLRLADVLKCVDLIAWDNLRPGMGKRSRRRGDYVLVLQKPPISASTWTDHGIPSRWQEKVDRGAHPHAKPIGLITRLIGAVTEPGEALPPDGPSSLDAESGTHRGTAKGLGRETRYLAMTPALTRCWPQARAPRTALR